MATHEFVVPKSIPMTLLIIFSLIKQDCFGIIPFIEPLRRPTKLFIIAYNTIVYYKLILMIIQVSIGQIHCQNAQSIQPIVPDRVGRTHG